MGLGQILPITPPAPNVSWTLDFWGPALQCNDVAATKRDKIWINIWNSYNTTMGPYGFLSWVPWSDTYSMFSEGFLNMSGFDRDLPFFTTNNSTYGPPPSSLSTDGPASLFIAILPEAQFFEIDAEGDESSIIPKNSSGCAYHSIQNLTDPIPFGCYTGQDIFTPASLYKNSTLLRCDLVNTSYSVEFSYSNSAMDLRISPNMTDKSPIVNASSFFIGPQTPGLRTGGFNTSEPVNCSLFQTHFIPEDNSTLCVFDIDAVRLLSYQSVMAAFNQLVIGAMQNQIEFVSVNTTIMKTILAETNELAFIRHWNYRDIDNDEDLQTSILKSGGWAYPGLVSSELPETRGDLKSTLEQLFQNFTISLLAEPYFQ